MKKKLFATTIKAIRFTFIFLSLVSLNLIVSPARASSEGECSERLLRSLGVAVVNCAGDSMVCQNNTGNAISVNQTGAPGASISPAAGGNGNVVTEAEIIANPFRESTWGTITPKAVVLHWTTAEYENGQYVADTLASRKDDAWPNGRALQLSVDKAGKIWQLSETLETRPAQTFPGGAADPWNDTTIGIEIESGTFGEDIPAYEQDLLNNQVQYEKVLYLVRGLMGEYDIKNEQNTAQKTGIFGHLEINPGNSDPGPNYMAKIREDLGQTPVSSGATQTNPAPQNTNCRCVIPGSRTDSSTGNKTFFIGDSLMVGMYYGDNPAGQNSLLNQASAAGLSVDTEAQESWNDRGGIVRATGNSIDAYGGKNIDGMVEQLNGHAQDFSAANADIIVIGLGTNYYGRDRKAQMRDFIDYIRGFNATAQIYWINTRFQVPDPDISYRTINAEISEVAAEKNFNVIDYASAVSLDPSMGPPTTGSDRIHLSWEANIKKSAFVISQILGGPSTSNPSAGSGTGVDFDALNDDQKIAQTFLIGINASQAEEIPAIVEKYKIGGVFILNQPGADENRDNDVFNVSYFNSLKQAAGGIPLIVASDEEGGRVQRFRTQIGEFPSAKELGEKSNQEVELIGKDMGEKLSLIGVNTVLAPVADLALPGSAAVTDLDRGFSADPTIVSEKADAFAKGLKSSGITPTYKHFPGLGSTAKNTDFDIGESPNIDTLRSTDLVVYETLVSKNEAFVMLNNAIVPGVTGSGEVFGTSTAGINILRNEYGFGGIITTDALNAEGVKNVVGDLSTSVPKALQAGVTMPLFAYPGDGGIQNIINSVKSQGIDVSTNLGLIANHKLTLGGGGNQCGGAKLPGNTNAEQAWNFLIDKMDPIHTAAALGNWEQESRIDPEIVNSIGATGIAQWLGGRKTTLMSRPEPLTLATQLQFAYDEFLGQNGATAQFIKVGHPTSGTYEQWLAVTDLATATEFFRRAYERPGEAEAMDNKRIQYATDYLTLYGSL